MDDAVKMIIEFIETEYDSILSHHSYCLYPEQVCTCKKVQSITAETKLITDGYIDSFSMVSLVHFIEKTFDIKFKDADVVPLNFDTVQNMVSLISKYR